MCMRKRDRRLTAHKKDKKTKSLKGKKHVEIKDECAQPFWFFTFLRAFGCSAYDLTSAFEKGHDPRSDIS